MTNTESVAGTLRKFFWLGLSLVLIPIQFEAGLAQTEIEAKITKGAVRYIEAIDIAVVDFTPKDSEYASRITQIVRNDLNFSLYFRVAEIDSFIRAILGKDFYNMDGWYQLGVLYLLDGSVSYEEGMLKAQINVADVLRKKVIKSFKFEAKPESYRALAHAISDEMVLQFTGQKGVLSTKMAYVHWADGNKEIYICDYDGENPHPVTNDRSINVSPAWSPDGGRLVMVMAVPA